jgi:hypothetical protein
MVGALRLSELLRPMGVPLPQILHADVDASFPTLALERLAGTGLAQVLITRRHRWQGRRGSADRLGPAVLADLARVLALQVLEGIEAPGDIEAGALGQERVDGIGIGVARRGQGDLDQRVLVAMRPLKWLRTRMRICREQAGLPLTPPVGQWLCRRGPGSRVRRVPLETARARSRRDVVVHDRVPLREHWRRAA